MENRRARTGLWLVNTLLNYRRLTLDELSRLWRSAEDLSGGAGLTRNQLRRAVSAALDTLGIVIECDRRDAYRYYIAANDNLKAAEWLISSQAIHQVVTESEQVRDRILLEEIPSGQHHLSTIVSAMTHAQAIEMVYCKFADSEPYTCYIEPYCIKLSQQRWYLLACKDHRPHLQVFALDRMQQLRILSGSHFMPPADFDAHAYFADYFGVYRGDGMLPQTVRIRATLFWRNYLRTLPLHASQREVEVHADSSVFEYTLAPTPDLLNYLLSCGPNIEVLAPATLRQQMRDAVARMDQMYRQ